MLMRSWSSDRSRKHFAAEETRFDALVGHHGWRLAECEGASSLQRWGCIGIGIRGKRRVRIIGETEQKWRWGGSRGGVLDSFIDFDEWRLPLLVAARLRRVCDLAGEERLAWCLLLVKSSLRIGWFNCHWRRPDENFCGSILRWWFIFFDVSIAQDERGSCERNQRGAAAITNEAHDGGRMDEMNRQSGCLWMSESAEFKNSWMILPWLVFRLSEQNSKFTLRPTVKNQYKLQISQ